MAVYPLFIKSSHNPNFIEFININDDTVKATFIYNIKILNNNKKEKPSVGILVFSVQMGVCLLIGLFKDVTLTQFPYKSLILG